MEAAPDLTPKPVSYSQVILTHLMQPENANPSGIVHGGVIMKEIDNAAGVVAVRHSRVISVTASIDRIDFFYPVYIGNLLTIKASLNRVGNSSMEIGVRAEAEDLLTGTVKHIASAYLTFVAIGKDGKGVKIPDLILETDEDRRRNREANQRKESWLILKNKQDNCRKNPDTCE